MRFGKPLPERIQNAPELALGLEFYYNAFDQLGRERPAGLGLSFIPLSSIIYYAQWVGLSESETQDFIVLIQKLDEAFIRWRQQKDGKSN